MLNIQDFCCVRMPAQGVTYPRRSFTQRTFYSCFCLDVWQSTRSSVWWRPACSWGTAGGSVGVDRAPRLRRSAASTGRAAPGKNTRNIVPRTSDFGSSCRLLLFCISVLYSLRQNTTVTQWNQSMGKSGLHLEILVQSVHFPLSISMWWLWLTVCLYAFSCSVP